MSRPDIETAMRALAADTGNPAALPDAQLIWERAAARPRWEAYDSAARIVRLAEQTACILSGCAGLIALISLLPTLGATLRSMDETVVRVAGISLTTTVAVAAVLTRELLAEE